VTRAFVVSKYDLSHIDYQGIFWGLDEYLRQYCRL
jgi:hypothetical protein